MAPRKKNKKLKQMAVESDEDRISALPDREIHRVLSFLPAHEAVQTCLLSRRWRYIWKSMPVLRVIDPSSWGGWAAAEFNKFVNHLLFFRDVTPLDEFEVRTYPYRLQMLSDAFHDSVEPFRYLQMWIRYALMRNVRVLRVSGITSDKPPLFLNGPLVSQHLVTLELCGVLLDGCSMDFSGCPLLEDLQISHCRISAHKMSSQSIRRLCIDRCEFPDYATRLQVLAQNLFALNLTENKGLTPFLGSMPLLVTAYVAPGYIFRDRCRRANHNGEYCLLDPCIDCYGSEKCVVLGGLSNATSLKLKRTGPLSSDSENILKRDLKWCLPFSKLKTLVVNGWVVGLAGCDVRGLICFLQRMPILVKLVLQIYDELTYKRKMDESCSMVEQFIPTEHLKIVEVSCRKDVQNVDKLVEILVACGMPPNIISIKRSDSQ